MEATKSHFVKLLEEPWGQKQPKEISLMAEADPQTWGLRPGFAGVWLPTLISLLPVRLAGQRQQWRPTECLRSHNLPEETCRVLLGLLPSFKIHTPLPSLGQPLILGCIPYSWPKA